MHVRPNVLSGSIQSMGDEALVHASDLPVSALLAKRQCSGCNPALFRRVNRVGILEKTLLTWLGFYPWECISCRRRRLFRDQGRKQRSSSSRSEVR